MRELAQAQSFDAAFAAVVDKWIALRAPIKSVVVLPLRSEQAQQLPQSEYLAARMARILATGGFRVLDRQNVAEIVREFDFDSLFGGNRVPAHFSAADAIVVGRYMVVNGSLHIELRLISVNDGALVSSDSMQALMDGELRTALFSGAPSGNEHRDVSLWETEREFGIRMSYQETGAGTLRLLDGVRQRMRAVHTRYLRDALGARWTDAEIESHFRSGRETSCEFAPGEVRLEVFFGRPQ